MGLSEMKQAMHDRLWNAHQRWLAMREAGSATKRELKLRGLREHGDANRYIRNLIFAGSTKRSVEETVKSFIEFAHEKFGVERLEDLGRREFNAFIEDGVARGLAASTLETRCSHLAKAGALLGRTASFATLSRCWARRIRAMAKTGELRPPERATPSLEIVERAVAILRDRDQHHVARTGEPRAYHLAARLQLVTAGRSVSATDRITLDALKDGSLIEIVGKGGKPLLLEISPDLHAALRQHLAARPVPLADRDAYRAAWRRAVRDAGGHVTGTHGLRRRSTQDFYRDEYARQLAAGASPEQARKAVTERAVERLGHSRDRSDQAACYLGAASAGAYRTLIRRPRRAAPRTTTRTARFACHR